MKSEDILKLKDNLFGAADIIRNEWKVLHNRLSVADQKKVDVDHFIELNQLNASQGYKAYKLLQEVLLERREIKNRIEELRPLMDFLNDARIYDNNKRNTVSQKVNSKINYYENANENRKYKARVMTELFNGEMII